MLTTPAFDKVLDIQPRHCLKLTSTAVLMNLIGNAVKFTANGYVRVNCSVEPLPDSSKNAVLLKFDIL